MPPLDLRGDVASLTAALVDIPSPSHDEQPLVDAIDQALGGLANLSTQRLGNVVIARSELGRAKRVVLAGHVDTVPSAGNLPHRVEGDWLWGLGSVDMKGGVAVILHMAAMANDVPGALQHDISCVLYDCEEVAAEFNGLQHLVARRADLLECDMAILLEPTDAQVEAGCQGTLRVVVSVPGVRAHSARSWMGVNAVHASADVLLRLAQYQAREPLVDGLRYREGLSAVGIAGGVAGNVIPDRCDVTVNYRFAPDRTVDQALDHVRDVFAGFTVTVDDAAPAARPGTDQPLIQDFVLATGQPARAKLGWTDVARFTELGVPALNFGPGDPALAHAADERVLLGQIRNCADVLQRWLTRGPSQGEPAPVVATA